MSAADSRASILRPDVIWAFRRFPLVLLGIAAAMRIDAYGVTEERYLLALIGMGCALVLASVLVRRPLDLRVLPLVAGALALIAAIGPFSTRDVTISSQVSRVRAIISSVPQERWAQSRDGGLSEDQKRELVSAGLELYRHGVTLEQVLSRNEWPKKLPPDSWLLSKDLNRHIAAKASERTLINFEDAEVIRIGSAILIEGTSIDWETTRPQLRTGNGLSYTFRVNGIILEVSGENTIARFDLSPLLTLEDKSEKNGASPVFQSIEGRKGELIVEQFACIQHPAGTQLTDVWAKLVLY